MSSLLCKVTILNRLKSAIFLTVLGVGLFPSQLLEVDDIGFHEDGAPVAKDGQPLGLEGHVGELLHRVAELGAGVLQEVAVAG